MLIYLSPTQYAFQYLEFYLNGVSVKVDKNNTKSTGHIYLFAYDDKGSLWKDSFDVGAGGNTRFSVAASGGSYITKMGFYTENADIESFDFADVRQARIAGIGTVPEPASLSLFGLGLIGLTAIRRLKNA